MDGLVLHLGGKVASYEQLSAPTVPPRTSSYEPVPHRHLVERARRHFTSALGCRVLAEGYGLARDGAQMFGVIRFEAPGGTEPWGPVVGLRNSYDKSLSVGVATGACVFVCDNLAFSGSSLTVLRRHPNRVLTDLEGLLTEAATGAAEHYRILSLELASLQGVPLSLDRGFAELGVLYGRQHLQVGQFVAAARAWERPEHAEHRRRDLYGWYQAVAWALRSAPPPLALTQHAALHAHALVLRSSKRRNGR